MRRLPRVFSAAPASGEPVPLAIRAFYAYNKRKKPNGVFRRIALKQKIGLKHYLIAAAVGLIGFVAPHLPLLYAVMPAAYGLVGAACGAGTLCFSLLISAAGAAFAGADMTGLVLYLPASLAIGLIVFYKRPWRTAAAVTAGAMFLGMYCIVCLPGVLNGTGPYGPVISTAKEVGELLSAEFTAAGAAAQAEAVQEIISNYVAIIPDSLLSTLLLTSLVWAGLSLVCVRAILRKKRDLRPMAPFREWRLPKGFAVGCLILLLGGFLLDLSGLSYAGAVYSCAEIIALLPLCLQGVALCDFLWYFRRKNVWGRVIAIAFLILLLPTSVFLFGALGLIDQFAKLRRRLSEQAKQQPPEK